MQIEILNEDGEVVFNYPSDDSFIFPHIFYDILSDKEKEPELKLTREMEVLSEVDLIAYSKPISKENAWAKRQKVVVFILPEETPVEEKFKKLKVLPSNHYFQIDVANSKIKIIGPFTDDSGWIYY